VQGPVLAKAIGKGSASTKQSSNHNKTSFDLDRTGGTWSWTKCFLQAGDISALHTPGGVSLEVQVADYESEWNGASITIPGELLLKDATLVHEAHSAPIVMANEWESAQVHDETDSSPTATTSTTTTTTTTHLSSTPPDDLIRLTHLNEPTVVNCLKQRYRRDFIYTATGPILIALNPFKSLPALYDDTIMNEYWLAGEGLEDSNLELKPHVYQIAHVAFRSMMQGLEQKKHTEMGDTMLPNDDKEGQRFGRIIDQSMLVSGESGAGKTVTTKHVMKYLATLSQRKADHSKQQQQQQQQRRFRESSPGRSTNETRLSRQLSTRYSHSSRATSWKVGAQVEERGTLIVYSN
jgi:Myosin head (motor domain)